MYITEKVSDNLIIIGEQTAGSIYTMQLVIGEHKAALIDTGLGEDDNLLEILRQFTKLPIILLVTHGHHDHVGHIGSFSEIYMSALDDNMLNAPFKHNDLRDGDTFDLGGVTICAYALPGHTDGSFCFLNIEEKYALTGDAINQCTWLWWDYCATLSDYSDNIRKFSKKLEKYGIKDIYHGHAMKKTPEGICADMIIALDEVAKGDNENDEKYYIDWEPNKDIRQHIYGEALIVYDKKRL